jgi:DNA-directed RNA polymerase III subunit RPC1
VKGHILNAARSNQDIVNQGVLEVSNKMLYDVDNGRKVIPNGPLDPRMVGNLLSTKPRSADHNLLF